MADLAKGSKIIKPIVSTVTIPAGLIGEAKAERLAHWARFEASAKK